MSQAIHHEIHLLGQAFEEFKSAQEQKLTKLEKKQENHDTTEPLVQAKLDKLNAHMDALQRQIALAQLPQKHPVLPTAHQRPHEVKALTDYLRFGDESGLRGLAPSQIKSTMGQDALLLPEYLVDLTYEKLRILSPLRALADHVRTHDDRVNLYQALPQQREQEVMVWGNQPKGNSALTHVNKQTINLYPMQIAPLVQQNVYDYMDAQTETWLANHISKQMQQHQNKAFLYGTGQNQPLGLLHAGNLTKAPKEHGVDKILTHEIGEEELLKNQGLLLQMTYDLPSVYRAEATWLVSRKLMHVLRSLRSEAGEYLFCLSDAGARFLGYPLLMCDELGEEAGQCSAVFGNFKEAFMIADGKDIPILRDQFSAQPHVLLHARCYVGSGLKDGRAVQALTIKIRQE